MNKKHHVGIHLIAADTNRKFSYQGSCKIVVNRIESFLSVNPTNKEFTSVFASFNWKFFAQKNILFIFAENDFQDFILVFNNEIKCKKVYDLIYQKRANETITNEEAYQRIISPMFYQSANDSNITISKILLEWINKLDFLDKKMYTQKLKDFNIYHLFYRKIKEKKYEFSKNYYDYKMVNIQGSRHLLKRLLVFPSADKKFCYEYARNFLKPNIFYCTGCKKTRTKVLAKMDQFNNPVLQDKQHVCTKLRYPSDKFFDLKIIKKPNYEILENTNTKTGKVLIIFNPNDRTQCHDFRWRNNGKFFQCIVECDAIAKIHDTSTENEYVELLKLNHECPFRPYNREKYFKFNNFVLAPNFELRTEMIGKRQRKNLIIFDANDKTKCFIYYCHSADEVYVCSKCSHKKRYVYAKIEKNSEGEEYVITFERQHICEPVKYVPCKNEDIIIHSPNFKVMEKSSTGLAKVFVFDSIDKNLCYIFTHRYKDTTQSRYHCIGCQNFLNGKSKQYDSLVVRLYLWKNDDCEYYVQMKNNQKHSCRPQKYEPEKFEVIQPTENYFYYRNKLFPKSINLAIFLPNDKNLCYTFNYSKSKNVFQCLKCVKVDKWYSISPPKMDENGKEYFMHNPSKHSCKPIKVSSISTSNFQKLEKNEIIFIKKIETVDSEIIKLPNFEFRISKFGEPEGKMIIFDSKDKTLCYEYHYNCREKSYYCFNCKKMKKCVTAKVHFDEKSNEKFVKLSKVEHICEPIKDEFAEKVIKSNNFMIHDLEDETKTTRIFVYTESKEFYYELRESSSRNCFVCYQCKKRNKFVGVKLYKKENGENYLLKMQNEHVCAPLKYVEPKIIPDSIFILCQNKNGEANKKLFVFTSEKKDFVYEYIFDKSRFRCLGCMQLNKHVSAKLQNDNEKYLELSNVEHICKPRKYDRKKCKN